MEQIRKFISSCIEELNILDCEKDGVCMQAAELLTRCLVAKGFSDFRVVEGYVWTDYGYDDDLYPTEHTWILLNNGQILDPSKVQFEKYGGIYKRISGTAYDADDEFYGETKYYTPQEYLDLIKKHPNDLNKWLKK